MSEVRLSCPVVLKWLSVYPCLMAINSNLSSNSHMKIPESDKKLLAGFEFALSLLGWDGVGLVSHCLVIYYQNLRSYNVGILTALSNRMLFISFILLQNMW